MCDISYTAQTRPSSYTWRRCTKLKELSCIHCMYLPTGFPSYGLKYKFETLNHLLSAHPIDLFWISRSSSNNETRLKLSDNHNNVYKGSKWYSVIKEPITVYFKVSKATLQKIEIGALAWIYNIARNLLGVYCINVFWWLNWSLVISCWMENRHPKKQVLTLKEKIGRSASNMFEKWRKEPKTSGINNIV